MEESGYGYLNRYNYQKIFQIRQKKARLSSLAHQPSTTNRFYNPKNYETIVMNYYVFRFYTCK